MLTPPPSSPMSDNKFLRYGIAAAVMFLTLFAWGVYFVPMGRYLSVAFPGDPNVTGFAYGAGPLAAMVSALIAGWLADKAISANRLFFVLAVITIDVFITALNWRD